jgi:hypothetical protein
VVFGDEILPVVALPQNDEKRGCVLIRRKAKVDQRKVNEGLDDKAFQER